VPRPKTQRSGDLKRSHVKALRMEERELRSLEAKNDTSSQYCSFKPFVLSLSKHERLNDAPFDRSTGSRLRVNGDSLTEQYCTSSEALLERSGPRTKCS